MSNPYAPPAEPRLASPSAPLAPLPEGIRRYRLDAVEFPRLVRRQLWVQRLRAAVVVAAMLLITSALGSPLMSTWVVLGSCAVGFAVGGLVAWLRARRVLAAQMQTFELLASDRIVRRVFVRNAPAEALRPEVTRVVETRLALWLVADAPKGAVAVTRALEGYDGLRDRLAQWRPVEKLGGLAGWWFTVRHMQQQRPRDAIAGTALERDPGLAEELRTMRAVAIDRGMGLGSPAGVRARLVRLLVLWVLLILMFLAIWQLLSPGR